MAGCPGLALAPPEARLRQRLALAPATACPMDGAEPVGTEHGVLVVQDEPARLLLPHAAAAEHGDEAPPWLPHLKDRGRKVPAACSDDSQSCTEALTAVLPQARLQADPVPPVQPSWGHLQKALVSSRRQVKASGEAQQEAAGRAWAQQWGPRRWSLLKPPSHVSAEEKQARAALASAEAGCVPRCRQVSRHLVQLFAQAHSAAPAQLRLHQLRQALPTLADQQLPKMPPCLDAHGEQA